MEQGGCGAGGMPRGGKQMGAGERGTGGAGLGVEEEDILGWEKREESVTQTEGSPSCRTREYGTSKQGREPWEGGKPGQHASITDR